MMAILVEKVEHLNRCGSNVNVENRFVKESLRKKIFI